jgi:hypothetical protein
MAAQDRSTCSLPELAEALYATIVARGATVECQFDNLEIVMPRAADPNAPPARWRLHGTVRVRATPPGASSQG